MPYTTPRANRQEARMETIVLAHDVRRTLRELDRELAALIEQNRRANQTENAA